MKSNRDPTEDICTIRTPLSRRRTLLGAAGLAASSLAGCLSSGASDSSNSSNSSGGSDTALPPPIKGDPQASVTVAAYEDFACPHCREYYLTVLPELESDYIDPGRIRYEHHDFPIPAAEPESYTAANAARATQDRADEGAFWEYARGLYENQSSLGSDLYASLADDMGLDGGAVREAGVDRQYTATVMGNREQGLNKGVDSTPTVFVAGEAVPETTAEAIRSAIEQAL